MYHQHTLPRTNQRPTHNNLQWGLLVWSLGIVVVQLAVPHHAAMEVWGELG